MARPASLLALLLLTGPAAAADWTGWRGPHQAGVSDETGLVERFSPEGQHLLWSVDLPGRGTPVVHQGRLYAWGYRGAGADTRQVLAALDLATGATVWERHFRDFLSDIIYDRYSIGAPAVDPATGDVFVLTAPGELAAFSREGEPRWQVSMMDAWGRLTFPNGRTGAPAIDGDLVIVHGITSSWGGQGPARDRFYAFDKRTGAAVWVATPGGVPRDSSFSTPLFETRDGRRLLYATTGSGEVVALDARTGTPRWRFPMARGGVDVSVVLHGDLLVAAHDKENLDSSRTGALVGIDVTAPTEDRGDGAAPVLLGERWRLDVAGGSSSPVLHDGVVYQVSTTGQLHAVEAATGEVLWQVSLGPDQLHASPLYADGRLWVPLQNGSFHVVRAGRDGGEVLWSTQLAGNALGAPAVVGGRVLVHTTEKLYAFGVPKEAPAGVASAGSAVEGAPGRPASLQVVPAEVLLRPGERVPLQVRVLDDAGRVIRTTTAERAEPWVPPTAKVKGTMDARFEGGALVAAPDAELSAGAWKVWAAGLEGTTRGRTVAGVPFGDDFSSYALTEASPTGPYGWPPLPWIGARFKWEVREVDGDKALVKTLDNMLFQRSVVFLGHPDESGYAIAAHVRSDGDRRQMSAVGVVNQRYLVALKGNQRVLEVSSNQERLKHSVPFEMKPGAWYRLVSEVHPRPDGSTLVRAKAWPRGEPEPDAWTLELVHPDGHRQGAPGLYGFTPRNLHAVYVDDVTITRLREAE